MGVGFFPCDRCGESICDCGDYERCNDDCGRRWCNRECAKSDGYLDGDDEGTCSYCRGDDVTDEALLAFLLKRFFLTHARAVKLWRKHRDK